MTWVYENMNIQENFKILDIGCGNGLFWIRNIEKLPRNLHIIMNDYSFGMLEKAENSLKQYEKEIKNKNITFEFFQSDANNLEINEEDFDVIIANHMLYHVINRQQLIVKLRDLLKDDGTFYCSTVGMNHMKELSEAVKKFDRNIDIEFPQDNIAKAFGLENGKEQLKESFRVVERKIHDNNLLVDDPKVIYDYVHSMQGNAAEILDKNGSKFTKMIEDIIDKHGAMFIQKSTGMFICKK